MPLRRVLAIALLIVAPASAFGQKLSVEIIDRQVSDSSYNYVVPGRATTETRSTDNCNAFGNSVNCSGSASSSTVITPTRRGSYDVRGATFSLRLPDGRIAVINCESKYKPRGDYVNRRSCRMPIVDTIEAEFKGDGAKLRWPVSLDGKKFESETYKIQDPGNPASVAHSREVHAARRQLG
jgi:hypothetical protein